VIVRVLEIVLPLLAGGFEIVAFQLMHGRQGRCPATERDEVIAQDVVDASLA